VSTKAASPIAVFDMGTTVPTGLAFSRKLTLTYSRKDAPAGLRCLSFEEDGDELVIRLDDGRDSKAPGLRIDKVRAMQVARGLREWADRCPPRDLDDAA